MIRKRRYILFCLLIYLLLASTFCSVKKVAMNQVAHALTSPGSSSVFTGDNDPDLIADALPFAIKMYESLLTSLPGHRGLQLKTGSLYVMYANAFIQTPAEMLPEDEQEKMEFQLQRAKNLYLRGRDMLMTGLEKRHPGFRQKMTDKKYDQALVSMDIKEIEFLYWAAAGWLSAFSIDPFDIKLGMTVPGAAAMMEKVLELDKNYGNGAISDFYILYYGSMPDYMGGSFPKAREYFKKSITTNPKGTSSYLSLATSVCVKEQNIEEFKTLINKVLEIDPDSDPDNRLVNTINHRKARWLLEHIEDLFLEASGLDDDEDNELMDDTTESEE